MVLTLGQGIQPSFSLAQDLMRWVSQLHRVVIQVSAALTMLDKGLNKASLCDPWVWTGLLGTLLGVFKS